MKKKKAMHRRERISEGKKKIKMILPNIFHRWFLCSKLENTKKTPEKNLSDSTGIRNLTNAST